MSNKDQQYIEVEQVRMECLSCKKLALRCKCDTPDHQEVKRMVNVVNPDYQTKSEQARNLTEEQRKSIVEEKMRAKAEKRAQREETQRIMSMDPEEFEKEKDKKSEEKKLLEKDIADRAARSVKMLEEYKQKLTAEGHKPHEIKKAVKDAKRLVRENRDSEQELKIEDLPELKNPVKDPETGKMVEKEDLEKSQAAKKKRGRKKKEEEESKE